jgi:hypothetical protein
MATTTNKIRKYELLNPVFEVRNGLKWGDRMNLAVIPYIRLNEPCSRGEAIRQLTAAFKAEYQTEDVHFMFWCDSSISGGGAPQEISL